MSAYIIINVDIHDAETYARYVAGAPATVEVHGGRYLVRGGDFEVVEGEWDLDRLVVIEFDDAAAAKAWHDSPEYAPLREFRGPAATMRMVIVEGIGASDG